MRRKKAKQPTHGFLSLSAASVAVIAVFASVFTYDVCTYGSLAPLRFGLPDVARAAPAESVPVAAQPVGLPVHIKIPSIGVDTTVESVALAADGSIGVPADPLDTAWYELGPRPGEAGSAVIDGHVNWFHGETGAFANLRKLKPGDVITVRDDGGTDISFVVRERREYAADAKAVDVFRSADDGAHLNLITCGGAWDKGAGQYAKRLVVFADRQTE